MVKNYFKSASLYRPPLIVSPSTIPPNQSLYSLLFAEFCQKVIILSAAETSWPTGKLPNMAALTPPPDTPETAV